MELKEVIVKTEITDEEPCQSEQLADELPQIRSNEAGIVFKSEIAENIEESLKLDYETFFDNKSFDNTDFSSYPPIKTEKLDINKEQEDDRSGVTGMAFELEISKNLELDYKTSNIRSIHNTDFGSFQPIKTEELDIKEDQENDRTEKKPRSNNVICGHCDYRTDSTYKLNRHMITHHKPIAATHCCDICDFKSFHKESLTRHRKTHDNERKLKCEFCVEKFKTTVQLDTHLLKKHENTGRSLLRNKLYKCDFCAYQTFRTAHLRGHMVAHHKSDSMPKYVCDVCSFETYYQSYLNVHVGIHSEVKGFKCDACGVNFNRKINLDNHIVRKHADDGELVKTITSKIKSTMQKYACDVCSYETYYKYNLPIHVRRRHSERFKCVSCRMDFKRKKQLDKHILEKHADDDGLMKTIASDSKLKRFKCGKCIIDFKRKMLLDHHILEKHADDDGLMKTVTNKINKCGECSFRTIRMSLLKRHLEKYKHGK